MCSNRDNDDIAIVCVIFFSVKKISDDMYADICERDRLFYVLDSNVE